MPATSRRPDLEPGTSCWNDRYVLGVFVAVAKDHAELVVLCKRFRDHPFQRHRTALLPGHVEPLGADPHNDAGQPARAEK